MIFNIFVTEMIEFLTVDSFIDKSPDIKLNHLYPKLDIQSVITYLFITVLEDDIHEDDV